MIAYPDAVRILRDEAKRSSVLALENIPIELARARICAESARAPEDSPRFANSSMDGFAILASDAPGTFTIRGSLMAERRALPIERLEKGEVFEIMTGAPVPPGADAVVKVEDVKVEAGRVHVRASVSPGQNLRAPGEDYRKCAEVLRKGERVRPEHLLALAGFGISSLSVVRKPRVFILSTGNEVVPHTTKELAYGEIRNSTAPYLCAKLEACGADVRTMGSLPDDPARFLETLHVMYEERPDLILTTGAVSMGKRDFIPGALEEIGAQILFHKVAVRPGKPILFARLPNGTAFFGIPGNTVSSAAALRFFIEPYLRALQGLPPEEPVYAQLESNVRATDGLRSFLKARLRFDRSGSGVVGVLPGQASFIVSSLVEANAWAVIPEQAGELVAGTVIETYPMELA